MALEQFAGDYVAYDYEDEFGLDAPQGPCEFCGKLYPLMLLIEHETGCEPEATSYSLDGIGEPPDTSEIENQNTVTLPKATSQPLVELFAPEIETVKIEIADKNKSEVKRVTENIQTQSAVVALLEEVKEVGEVARGQDARISRLQENSTKRNENVEAQGARIDVLKEVKNRQFQKQRTEEVEMKGETLMSFGAAESSSKESDKNMQQECAQEVEDIEDINNLSDDDCSETLEEFWQRANVALKRTRMKNI